MAAKLASPKSDVIIMYGDGAFGLNMMEFEACIRQKINIVGIIGNDAAWTQILRGQVQIYGPTARRRASSRRRRYDLMIEAMGGHGEWVETPGELRPAHPARADLRQAGRRERAHRRRATSVRTPSRLGPSRMPVDRTAGIVIIGNEILSGRVTDTNSPFLARELRKLGVTLLAHLDDSRRRRRDRVDA
jgi:hypothetical protein